MKGGYKMVNLKAEDFFSDASYADNQYEIICEEIKAFEDELDSSYEVGLIMPNNSSVPFIIESVGYHNPYLIMFYGYINNKPSQLIQHVNQINLSLIAVPKEKEKPKRKIGFQ